MELKLPFINNEPKEETTDQKIESTLNQLVDDINASDKLNVEQKVEAVGKINCAMKDVHERKHHVGTIIANLMASLLPIMTCVGGMMFTSLWEEARMTNRNVFGIFMETVKSALRKK